MKPYFIGIAGPSGAGKSVFCKILQSKYLGISRLKLDDFFKDIQDVPIINGAINWDHPNSLKWDIMLQAANDLKSGKHAIVPNYSRKHDKCIGEKCVPPAKIMLFDGFMTLTNPDLRELIDLKLYFDLTEDSQIKRRKIRQPEVSDEYINSIMLPAARKYISPSKQYADHVIDAEMSPNDVADQCIEIIRANIGNINLKLK